MLQGALGNILVVPLSGCPGGRSALRLLKAWLIEVGIIDKDHALDAQQHLTSQEAPKSQG